MGPDKRRYVGYRLLLGAALGTAAQAIHSGIHPVGLILGAALGAAIYGTCAILLYRYR